LADRAVALGWTRSPVGVLDEDLGKGGQSIAGRPGFQRLLAAVARDRVGRALGLAMSRLARSCTDWHQLLELGARFRVLLADADAAVEGRRRQLTQHWEQRLARARFEADRAARPYHACEPESRLVARTLERRWDEALPEVQRLGADYDRFARRPPRLLREADRAPIRPRAEGVPALWHAPTATAADRRQIARLLSERVVLPVDPADDRAAVRLGGAGGAAQPHRVRRAVRGSDGPSDGPRLSARLAALQGAGRAPAVIAAALDGEGFRSPPRWTGRASDRRRAPTGSPRRGCAGCWTSSGCVRGCRGVPRRPAGAMPARGGCTNGPGTWACRRTRGTGGGGRAGGTPARSAAAAARGRCGPRTPNAAGCGNSRAAPACGRTGSGSPHCGYRRHARNPTASPGTCRRAWTGRRTTHHWEGTVPGASRTARITCAT